MALFKQLLVFIYVLSSFLFATGQDKFYKQFLGKIGDESVRILLIYAPAEGNNRVNLRGYYYSLKEKKYIELNNGFMDQAGNFSLEEGYFAQDTFSGDQLLFVKTAQFSGNFTAASGILKGMWKKNNSQDILSFFLREDYGNGGIAAEIIYNDKTYETARIRFHYPRFVNHLQAQKLNQFLADSLLGNMNEKIDLFANHYRQTKETGGMTDLFENNNICYILLNDHQILSLQYKIDAFTGGAHGYEYHQFYNFDLKTGQRLHLKDLFVPGFEKEMLMIVERTLKSNFNLRSDQSLNEFGFTLPNNQLYLPRYFYLRRDGIGFFYNLYEIAPYAIGHQDVFIPFSKIRHLISKQGLLSRFLAF